MEFGLLEVGIHKLAVCFVWHLLCSSKPVVDVYCEAFSAEYVISHGVVKLCLRHDWGDSVFSRDGGHLQVDRSGPDNDRMFFDSKMKYVLCIIISFLISLGCFAQGNSQQIIIQISGATSKLTSMQCDFVQTKTVKMLNEKLVSKGRMYYQQPNRLRWEYMTPYTYTFVFNGQKVSLKKNNRNDVIDVNQNKMFKEIASIMMNSVIGTSLTDRKSFKTTVKDTPAEWVATLVPQSKELKQMFTSIVLHFNKEKSVVVKVEMFEKNGDTTVIALNNIIKNQKIDAKIFTVN
jgi:outer membrane lipoprotein carrier protein